MTILEALQSLAEYKNDNLLSKVISDMGLTATSTYVPSEHRVKVDLACADLYETLAAHPDFTEGKYSVKYNAGTLLSLARQLRSKHGINSSNPTTNGKSIW